MLSVEFYVTVDNRAEIRRKVVEFSRFCRIKLPDEEMESIVGEVVQNILRHAYPDDHRGRFSVCYEKINTDCFLTFQDFGRGFDSSTVNPHLFKPSESGGMGLSLMCAVAEPAKMFIYSQKEEGTQILFRFSDCYTGESLT